jgi:hypothetical protein
MRPLNAERLEIRCNVGDVMVANLAVHVVFFFERRLDTRALGSAFARALTNLPIFAGRMATVESRMRIRCEGQGVPFTSVSSGRTLREAIRSASEDTGLWLVEDRAAYLDEHLPADGAREPGVRCLGLAELARSALYLAKDARKQRTLGLYFGEDEIARMRDAYGYETRLSANDVVCAHISEVLMKADPTVDGRTLAIAVDARSRCGLDPMLIGNIITTLNVDLRRGEAAGAIAARIRHTVDHFADEHCDMRINQQFLDAAGAWRGARCVAAAFDPARWNPLVSNWSGFGIHRIRFEDTFTSYCTPLMSLPVAGLGALVDGADGRGLIFQMSLPPNEFEAMSRPGVEEHMHRFRCAGDDIPRLQREVHG